MRFEILILVNPLWKPLLEEALSRPRNIGLLAIHTKIDRVFQRNLLVEEGLLGIRDMGLKREPKKDLSCTIL
jgi:hypothetical protein